MQPVLERALLTVQQEWEEEHEQDTTIDEQGPEEQPNARLRGIEPVPRGPSHRLLPTEVDAKAERDDPTEEKQPPPGPSQHTSIGGEELADQERNYPDCPPQDFVDRPPSDRSMGAILH